MGEKKKLLALDVLNRNRSRQRCGFAAHEHNAVTCQSVKSWMYTNNKQPHALMNLNETQTHFSKCLYHLCRMQRGSFNSKRKMNFKLILFLSICHKTHGAIQIHIPFTTFKATLIKVFI